jgi:hypothetical protein
MRVPTPRQLYARAKFEGCTQAKRVYELHVFPHPLGGCGIVWNCSDILPSLAVFGLEMCGIEISRRTYAAAARALLPAIKDAQLTRAA